MNVEDLYSLFRKCGYKFTTDTRKVSGGEIYFALKGPNFNGNLFAAKALELGASIAIVDEEIDVENPSIFQVDDVLKMMQQLATYHRRQFDIPIVAIAGSNGKTTTKELISVCLAKKYRVHATSGNFNNHIGVPITLLEMPVDAQMGIIEIGTNAFGEIKMLCEILHPSHGIITNIGKEHLEGFGNLEGVAKEESELFNYLHQHSGFAFVNSDDIYLNRMSHRLVNKRSYGFGAGCDRSFEVLDIAPKLRLESNGQSYTGFLQGRHNAQNMAAAITIAEYFSVSSIDISSALDSYRSSNNRSEWREIGSNTFLLDAYNANPSSMMAALQTFDELRAPIKIVVLGDMFELGITASNEHTEVAEAAWRIKDAEVYLAGSEFGLVCDKNGKKAYKDVDEVIAELQGREFKEATFLIKGSRGMKMERVLEAFTPK